MAEIRKLGRKTDHRLAMLKNLTTSVIWHGQIETTEAKAKEVKSIVDSLISLAIKEKDNYEIVEETVSLAKIDEKTGNKVTETVTSKNGKSYTRVVREKVKELNEQMREVYEAAMANESMVNYTEKEQQLSSIVNNVKQIIDMTLSGEDPMTCEPSSGCTGSCATCGGCH